MHWHVRVLGGLILSARDQTYPPITRFESRKVAALLAYLALFPYRSHPREELVELLWPDVEPEAGRHRLRQALSTLRRQLEPPGAAYGSVLAADRQCIAVAPSSLTCDALEFEHLVDHRRFSEAAALYGELLPGLYDEWVLLERHRLAALYEAMPGPVTVEPPGSEPDSSIRLAKPETRPDLPAASSALLPVYLTAFLGREEELSQGSVLLDAGPRLVTLTGLGGAGKTRLVVELARRQAAIGSYDLVAFAPLAECIAPGAILESIRAALGLSAAPGSTSTLEWIVHTLTERRALLVLDNFEQLVEGGGATVVETLLARLPALTCLVTSRRLLGVPGEQELPLLPLDLPPEEKDTPLEIVTQASSLALFLNRAQMVRPGYQITKHNREDLIALCHALEGLPLALELAASRIRALSPSEMRDQIADRFRWLVRSGPGADKEPRHRSLAAALEWSWRLLPPAQQRFLASLSVFHGGWTAESAAAVSETADARERLEALAMDSLVLSEETSSGTTRFRMLETVRSFVREHLPPDDMGRLRQRHRETCIAWASRKDLIGPLFVSEADNFVAAMATAVEDGDTDIALRLGALLDERWLSLMSAGSALNLLNQALNLPAETATRARVETLGLASYLALIVGDRAEADRLAKQSLLAAGEREAERAIALITCGRVIVVSAGPLSEAQASLSEALELACSAGERRTMGDALRLLAVCDGRLGNYDEAERRLREAMPLLEAVEDRAGILRTLDNLANMALQRGDLERALALYRQGGDEAVAAGDVSYQAKVYQNLATIYARQERWDDSIAAGCECIRQNHALGNVYMQAYAFWNLPEPLSHTGQEETAAQLMAFAERLWVSVFSPLNDNDLHYRDGIRAHIQSVLGETRTRILWAEGECLTLTQAVALALNPSESGVRCGPGK